MLSTEKILLARNGDDRAIYRKRYVEGVWEYKVDGVYGELNNLSFVWLSTGWYCPELHIHAESIDIEEGTLLIAVDSKWHSKVVIYLEETSDRNYVMYEIRVIGAGIDNVFNPNKIPF